MMEEELGAASLTWNTAMKTAQDRRAWRTLAEAPCATGHDGKKF
jgi:hypothetical protein